MNKNTTSIFLIFIIIPLVFIFLNQRRSLNENYIENKNLKIKKEMQEFKITKMNESKEKFDDFKNEYDLSELRKILISLLDKNKILDYSLKNNSDEIILNFICEKSNILKVLNEIENLEYVPKISEAQIKNNKVLQVNLKILKTSFKFKDKIFFPKQQLNKKILYEEENKNLKKKEVVFANHDVSLISKIKETDNSFFYWIKDENFCIKKLIPEKIIFEDEDKILIISNNDKYSIRKN